MNGEVVYRDFQGSQPEISSWRRLVSRVTPASTSEIPGSLAIPPPGLCSFSLGQRLGVTYIPKGNDDTASMMRIEATKCVQSENER